MADDWRGILHLVGMFTQQQVQEIEELPIITASRLVRLENDQWFKMILVPQKCFHRNRKCKRLLDSRHQLL